MVENDLTDTHPPSATTPLSRSAMVNYSNMDSATSPSASRRMTKVVFFDDSEDYKKWLSKVMYI